MTTTVIQPSNDYKEFKPKWDRIRQVVNGYNVKDLIPDVSSKDKARNERYRNMATFLNFTAATLDGLLGAVFRK